MTSIVTDTDFKSQVLDSNRLVLVDFWADWCGPCKALGPIVDMISDTNKDKINVVKLNIDDNPNTPTDYNIRGVPTLILFKNGVEVERVVGITPKAKLQELVDKHA